MMSKSGVAGYIGSFPIPEVVMGINAFTLAAQINPRVPDQGGVGELLARPR
jgi:basic membrane protein A and related proteins